MGKKTNHKSKLSHGSRREMEDRSIHWKHGKTSGNPELSAARRERKAKRK